MDKASAWWKVRLLLTVMVLPMLLPGPAWAGFEEGVAAYKRGDYARAFREFRPLAEQGGVAAQFNLGVLYQKGQGIPQDYAEAAKWYRRAAEQGYAVAQHDLGVMYTNGQGIPQDYAEAAKWYRRAAEQGYANSQYNLGVAYARGEGVPQDYVQAHMWLNLAASRYPAGEQRDKSIKVRDANKMTPAQVAQAEQLARQWKPTAERASK